MITRQIESTESDTIMYYLKYSLNWPCCNSSPTKTVIFVVRPMAAASTISHRPRYLGVDTQCWYASIPDPMSVNPCQNEAISWVVLRYWMSYRTETKDYTMFILSDTCSCMKMANYVQMSVFLWKTKVKVPSKSINRYHFIL